MIAVALALILTFFPVVSVCRYKISESELATRVLNVCVWHDKIGYNVFLGEVNINMDEIDLTNEEPKEYELKPRV